MLPIRLDRDAPSRHEPKPRTLGTPTALRAAAEAAGSTDSSVFSERREAPFASSAFAVERLATDALRCGVGQPNVDSPTRSRPGSTQRDFRCDVACSPFRSPVMWLG